MKTHNILYAKFAIIIFTIFSTTLVFTGCGVKYNYSNINTAPYSKAYLVDLPTAPTQELNQKNIALLPYVNVLDLIITINNPTLTNYIISDLSNYIFIFETDTIVTISTDFHSTYTSAFISTATNLYMHLTSNVSCGVICPPLPNNLSTDCSIIANNLFISGHGTIYSEVNCVQANATTIIGQQTLKFNSANTAINSTNVYMCCGEVSIFATTGIVAINLEILGGTSTFLCNTQAVNCTSAIIKNGLIDINATTGITCNSFVKSGGFLVIKATTGITCQNAEISSGYLYADCKIVGIKAIYALNFNNGVAVVVATKNNNTAIDAEPANFNVYGGTLITNSSYACAPNGNALFFGIDNTKILVLQNSTKQLVYIPQVSGTLMVASNIKYSFFSTAGKITSINKNFFGLLLDASVNTHSNKAINFEQPNMGGIIYNGEPAQNGQLF